MFFIVYVLTFEKLYNNTHLRKIKLCKYLKKTISDFSFQTQVLPCSYFNTPMYPTILKRECKIIFLRQRMKGFLAHRPLPKEFQRTINQERN